ncbi:LuxR C-terminal-related transcriptional regulator [Streptomyces sp. NPDC017991]|uniref:helix-turn-helix transcriptional regulator n=1 Tax=Streptomyces sp. NPDC017991 TaxID=3365026 RepID=UPI0037A31EEF
MAATRWRELVGVSRPDTGRGKYVGRYDLLRTLSRALDDTAEQGVVRCVVSGEAGIGRTMLLGAFLSGCQARGIPVIAVADQVRMARELRRPADGHRPTGPASRHAVRGSGTVLVAGSALAGQEASPAEASKQSYEPTAAGARNLLVALRGRGPMVLAVDDANLADTARLQQTLHILAETAGLPLLVLLTERAGEPPCAPAEYRELTLAARRLTLEGLTLRETGEMLRPLLGRRPGGDVPAACHRLTAGNPYLLASLAAQLRGARPWPGPQEWDAVTLPAATDLLVGRAARQHPHAARLAATVAVAGDSGGADPALIAHLSGLGLVETLEGLDVLARHRLIADGEQLVLRHPLLAHTLLGSMTQLARDAVHLSAASYLYERHAPVRRVADHLSASTVPHHEDWPTDVMLRAAGTARQAGHEGTARRYLENVVAVGTGDERHQAVLELADLHVRLDPDGGAQALVTLLRRAGDNTARSGLLARLGQVLSTPRHDPGDTAAVLDAAGVELRGTVFADWPQLHRLAARLDKVPPAEAMSLFRSLPPQLRPGARTARGDMSTDPAEAPDDWLLQTVVEAVAAYYAYLVDDSPRRSVDQARAVLARGTRWSEVCPAALAAALTVLADSGHPTEAAAHLDRISESTAEPSAAHPYGGDADPLGAYGGRADLLHVAGRIASVRGDLDLSCRLLTAGLAVLARPDATACSPALRATTAGQLANVLISQGKLDEAQAMLRNGGWLGRLPTDHWHQDLLLARARCAAGHGALTEAARDLAELRARAHASGLRHTGTAMWRAHGVELLDQIGAADEARTLAERQVRFARASRSACELGGALRVLARVDTRNAEALLSEAVALLAPENAPLSRAAALTDLADLYARQDRGKESIAALNHAVELAERCGAGELALRAGQRILALSGDMALHASLSGVLALTPREREILVDAMRGLTNRHISQKRAITRRTVELHLSSAYRKLGVSGRPGFPTLFRAPGLWTLLTSTPTVRRTDNGRPSGAACEPSPSVGTGAAFGPDRDVPRHRLRPEC